MGEHKAGTEQQPLLFMTRGINEPFNTRADRSQIARHLSKRYHRQKLKPLYAKILTPSTRNVEYPIPYYHGGQRLFADSDSPPAKKRKLAVKKEKTGEPTLSRIPTAARTILEDSKEARSKEDWCRCRLDSITQAQVDQSKDNVEGLRQPQVPADNEVDHKASGRLTNQPLIRTPLADGWRGDPFHCLPIPATGCVPLIIDYFLKRWAPDFDRDYRLSGYHDPHLSIVLPLAVEHVVLFESLIAMCRVFWLRSRGETWQDESEYLKHRGRALALVQTKLECNSIADDATLLAIVCLTSIELLASNGPAIIAHAHGLKLLVEKRSDEGIESATNRYAKASARAHSTLGQYIKRRSTSTDMSRASSASQSPSGGPLKSPTYIKHPFAPSVCKALSLLPVGFCELALTGTLSLECISILKSLSRKTEEWAVLKTGAEVNSEIGELYHLHELEGKTATEDFLVYGLLSFCNQFPDKFEDRNPFFNIALKCFDDGIKARAKINGIGHEPWLLWVSMVIAGVLNICAEPLEGRHVVLDTLLDECENAHDWSWLEKCLREFLWTDKLGGHWRRCWEEGTQRREERVRNSRSPSSSCSTSSRLFGARTLPDFQSAGLMEVLRDSYELSKAYAQA